MKDYFNEMLILKQIALGDGVAVLFIFVLFEGYVRLRNFWAKRCGYDGLCGRAPRLGQARGPGAAARSPSSRHSESLKTVTPFNSPKVSLQEMPNFLNPNT